jgi:hypothetical protein
MVRELIDTTLQLDTQAMNTLVLDPKYVYDNPFASATDIYKTIVGKSKVKMTHLTGPSFSLQPKSSCDNWNPTVKMGAYSSTLETCDFELNGEQCPDEFDAKCARFIRDGSATKFAEKGYAGIADIEAAMILTLRESLGDDFSRVINFGDTNFEANLAAGKYNLSQHSPQMQKNIITQMSTCNGIWAEIFERGALADAEQKVRILDTYDGTLNAADPANITDFLRDMIKKSHPLLQAWSNMDKRFKLQPELFDALIQYYQSRNTEASMAFLVNGVPVQDATTFNGIPVLKDNDANMYDYTTGNMSKKARAILTVRENLTVLFNALPLEGFGNDSLIVQKSLQVKDKGKSYMYGAWGLGAGIAQPQLITAAINSVDMPA